MPRLKNYRTAGAGRRCDICCNFADKQRWPKTNMQTMKPSRAERATHIILAGAPPQTLLLHSVPSEVPQEYLPAFKRFFKLDDCTAAGPGLPVPVGTLFVGPGDPISNGESPWRELLLKRKYPGTADSEARHRHRRMVRMSQNSAIAEEGTVVPKPTVLAQGLESISISFNSATSVDATPEVDHDEGAEDDEAAAAQLLHDESTVASFNRSYERSQTDGDAEMDVDFLNHSFICYQTAPGSSPPILSSPLPASSIELDITTSQFTHLIHEDSLNLATNLYSFSTSFHTSLSSISSSYEEDDTPRHPLPPSTLPPLPPLSSLTDLEDLPTPKELEKIQSHKGQNPFYRPKPISSIVGIISMSQPILCSNKSEMVKLMVGDETASGVGVTIWLESGSIDMRGKLYNNEVRPLDVVLLRNMILNTYMGRVYLNSMRNGKTDIEVLYRCGERRGGYRPNLEQEKTAKDQQVEKVRRVVEWVESFVGIGGWDTAGVEDGDMTILPEDTQLPE